MEATTPHQQSIARPAIDLSPGCGPGNWCHGACARYGSCLYQPFDDSPFHDEPTEQAPLPSHRVRP